jgi:DNA-directed RNA polymerase subunit alpha
MIPLPLKPKIIKKQKSKTIFEIEALYPGYGVTIGNSLRRVLLSSLGGAAITQVKIKNVSHEFSTIPGVLEDVVNIMLNLKQMRFRILSEEPQKASLKVKGKKEVKGSDFKLPGQLELVNKDCHIATLTESKASLEMEIQVEKGIGYIPRELKKKGKQEIGVIALDAIFTPVKRVSFRVENMRVGKRTNFDRLFLEIETDETISPEDAFSQASEILLNHFNLFSQAFVKKISVKTEEKKEQAKKTKKKTKVKDEKKKKRKKT